MSKYKLSLLLVSFVMVIAACNSESQSGDNDTEETTENDINDESANNAEEGKKSEEEMDYPVDDITFTIPNGAGGGNDLTTRALIPGLEDTLGVTVIPENKPASGGAVAARDLANAAPDGQEIYFNSQTLLLMPHGGVDGVELENYQPVAQVVEDTASIVVNGDAPYETLDDLIEDAKNKPGELRMAHNGDGALWNLSATTFAQAAGLDFNFTTYEEGGSQMLTAVASGESDIAAISPSESSELIADGQVKVLAVMSEESHPVVPDVPTAQEEGLDVTFPVWRGIFTTADVDEEKLEILETAIQSSVETDDFQKYLETNGMPKKFRGYEEFTEFVEEEKEKYDQLLSDE